MSKTTRDQLLDEAERLCQTRGFNAFSFKALASALEIKTASVHYHFPAKADLALALIQRYHRRFEELTASLPDSAGATKRLSTYADVFVGLAKGKRLCLCGSLASDLATLSPEAQDAVRDYFRATEGWLERVLEAGRDAGELSFAGPPREAARATLSLLEGALLTGRAFGSPKRVRDAKRWILDHLSPSAAT